MRRNLTLTLSIALLGAAAAFAGRSAASAPPIGPLPAGPVSKIQTSRGQLVAFALPHRPGGRTWRVARPVDAAILREVSEADVGSQVVLVFRTTGRGTAAVVFALTLGERPKAYESRRYTVTVR